MQASDITRRAGRLLFDPDHVRWTEPELIDYVNDAQMQIVTVKPEASAVVAVVSLSAGTRQTIPNDGLSLLSVIRNMGSNGSTPGRSIVLTSLRSMDAWYWDWHQSQGAEVRHFAYDPEVDRKAFFVIPGARNGHQVEIVYAAKPAPATQASSNLALSDTYINAILDWVLYRCYSREDEAAGSNEKAARHEKAFYQSIGASDSATTATSPNRKLRGDQGG